MVLKHPYSEAPVSGSYSVEDDSLQQFVFYAMGTVCEIAFRSSAPEAGRYFKSQALKWVEVFEGRCSRYRSDSIVSKLNASAGKAWVELDEDTETLFSLCDWFYWSTRGVFDPTVLPLLQLWDYKMEHIALPESAEIDKAMNLVGWNKVQRKKGAAFLPAEGMAVDLGCIGKEYAVDRVIEMALKAGIENVLVNFGHDLRVHGYAPQGGAWRIGLENPVDPANCWTGLSVRNRAVCSSGNYLRSFSLGGKNYGHILDPRTGYPVDNGCRSVSVIAPSCTEAGILSTCAFIMGAQDGLSFLDKCYQAEGCIWHGDSIHQTRRFNEYQI